jgi:hypothetical protein
MKTTEINKKFAEFLEVKKGIKTLFYLPQFGHYQNSYGQIDYVEVFREDELKFHNDWNWLMLVIQEIANKTGYVLVNSCGYSYWNKFCEDPLNKEFGGYENIENVYQACSEFIEWWNLNKY